MVRKVLEQNGGNVSKTARILGISRKTVRRAREGPLEDLSRRPKNSPRRIQADFEQLILSEAKRTGYGPMSSQNSCGGNTPWGSPPTP